MSFGPPLHPLGDDGLCSIIGSKIKDPTLTAFPYTGSPKTEQGGDNQARHVVLTLESGITLLEALFPVKSRKRRKSRKKVYTPPSSLYRAAPWWCTCLIYFGFSCYMCILVSQSVSQADSGFKGQHHMPGLIVASLLRLWRPGM